MVSWPLLTPQTFLFALTHQRCAAKRELRGLGSGRRFAYETLLGPESTLRSSPRITVRGHPVQSVRLLLRKAPLRSIAVPWSTKHICGPLAFSRATEGRRGLRESLGESRGGKETTGVLSPFCPPPGGGFPCRRRRQLSTPSGGVNLASSGEPLYRRNRLPSAEGNKRGALIACGGKPPERRNRSPSAEGKERICFSRYPLI